MSPSTEPPWIETLPDPLPADPLELASQWLAQARMDAAQPNPNAMVLATADENGQPSARVVLCKDIVPETGHIVFYTNYQSRKGRELRKNPRAAIVFHWDHRHRQVRAEGHVEPLDDAQNDAYFRTRPWQSRIGAWASRQSEPVASRADLGESVAAAARRFGIPYGGPGTQEPAVVAGGIPAHSQIGRVLFPGRSIQIEPRQQLFHGRLGNIALTRERAAGHQLHQEKGDRDDAK